ncbi:MAG: DUF5666 domain-containing protein [Gammaproteobacteria bacterium]|nr:DUF5666 domain-containing protein [Gammaproteobacteria bacterium]
MTALAAMCAACEIDQGGGPTPQPVVQTAAVTYGPIEGFSSVIVNGEIIPINSSVILANGVPVAETDLNVGQVVRVLSLIENNAQSALLVEYQANVTGPVSAVDTVNGVLTVLGQTVNLSAVVNFDIPGVTTIDDIVVGTNIEVSALKDTNGDLFASYLGVPAINNQFSLGTSISAVDLNTMQFTLGGVTIDYSQASILEIPFGQPAIGQVVLVTGVSLGGAGELIADSVVQLAAEPGIFSVADTDLNSANAASLNTNQLSAFTANFVGFIEISDNATNLTINNVTVSFDAMTTIVGGAAADLNVGTRVRVSGEVTNLGNVLAAEITIL